MVWENAGALRRAAFGEDFSDASFSDRARKVRGDFWAKLKRFAGKVPFVDDVVAAYYCALDPATPMRLRWLSPPMRLKSSNPTRHPSASLKPKAIRSDLLSAEAWLVSFYRQVARFMSET